MDEAGLALLDHAALVAHLDHLLLGLGHEVVGDAHRRLQIALKLGPLERVALVLALQLAHARLQLASSEHMRRQLTTQFGHDRLVLGVARSQRVRRGLEAAGQ